MAKHEEEYKILIMIAFISLSICIVITMVGILCCRCNPYILPCRRSKIKNIYTMHNVILPEEDAL